MRVLKDFLNNDINFDRDYSPNELMALMYLMATPKNIFEFFNYSNVLIRESCVEKILGHIEPINESDTFDIYKHVLNSIGVSIVDDISFIKDMCIFAFQDVDVDVDISYISFYDYVRSEYGDKKPIFKIDGRYFCRFTELHYDEKLDQVYSTMAGGIPIHNNYFYGVWNTDTNKYSYRKLYFSFSVRGIKINTYFYENKINIYRFDTMDEFNKSQKLFGTNTELAKHVYNDNKIFG